MKTKLILSTLLLGAIISCKKDDPVEPVITNEHPLAFNSLINFSIKRVAVSSRAEKGSSIK